MYNTNSANKRRRSDKLAVIGFAAAVIGFIIFLLSVIAVWVFTLITAHDAIEPSIDAQWIVWVLAFVVASTVTSIYTGIVQFILGILGIFGVLFGRL